MTKILLVGGGLTSAISASILRRALPKADIFIWDKAKKAGGRMVTFKRNRNSTSSIDIGAQYISVTSDYEKIHSEYYSELEMAKVLTPLKERIGGMKSMDEGTKHYVTPEGISSIFNHFFMKSKSSIEFEHKVCSVDHDKSCWSVKALVRNSLEDATHSDFDIVVLTMPVPQILDLKGHIASLIGNDDLLKRNLEFVEYSSRFVLGLFFSPENAVSLPDAVCAQYVTDDPIIRFVAIDNIKRGKHLSPATVVVHTSGPFGKQHLEETNEAMEPRLLKHVREMFPSWPTPEAVHCHKWLYSQVCQAFPGRPGAFDLGEGLILGGDGFSHSSMDGCIESAEAIARLVLKRV